ncbi:MAG: hypothetical protein GEU90_15900, partial [Gemmatimonas sp.]|nr:hypothetical protein [Gemmatimonas sp.]
MTSGFDLEAEALAIPEVAVTVGSRAAHSAADELGVPVDVFEAHAVQATSRIGLSEILQELSPSINFDQQANADLT